MMLFKNTGDHLAKQALAAAVLASNQTKNALTFFKTIGRSIFFDDLQASDLINDGFNHKYLIMLMTLAQNPTTMTVIKIPSTEIVADTSVAMIPI